jgi:DNA-binding XRE family transcriptional regulator
MLVGKNGNDVTKTGDFAMKDDAYKIADIEIVDEGVDVFFKDGLSGVIKFDIFSISSPIIEVNLESPYCAVFSREDGKKNKIPWDFLRRELDSDFRDNEKEDALAARRRLGRRISEIRNAKDLTQEKLATRAGLNRTTISRIETGKHPTSFDTLHDISVALDVSLPELVTLDKPAEKVA